MNLDLASHPVIHNEPECRFEMTFDGSVALAAYRMREGLMVMNHTEVPQHLEGRGVAGKLVRTALDYARSHDLKVLPTCSYVVAFFQKNPQYQDLLRPEDRPYFIR